MNRNKLKLKIEEEKLKLNRRSLELLEKITFSIKKKFCRLNQLCNLRKTALMMSSIRETKIR